MKSICQLGPLDGKGFCMPFDSSPLGDRETVRVLHPFDWEESKRLHNPRHLLPVTSSCATNMWTWSHQSEAPSLS